MSIQFFTPPATFCKQLKLNSQITLAEVCELAGVPCAASGEWINRPIEIQEAETLRVFCEPGDWGAVRIEIPNSDIKTQSRIALSVLAYSLHDLVARESIRHAQWNQIVAPRGRPRLKAALSNKERQRRFRKKLG